MEDAAQQHDYSTMIGAGYVVASGFMALGAVCCVAAASSATTGVGIPLSCILAIAGGIAATAGWVLITVGEESGISLFVSHCVWGANYGHLGNTEKPWSVGPFRGWVDCLDKQATALLNIVSSFTVEAWNIGWLRVYCGNVSMSSRFDITFESRTSAGVHRPRCSVEVGPKRMIHTGGDPIQTTSPYFMFGQEDGRHYFQILPRWPPYAEPPGWRDSDDVKCTVRLDVSGDGSFLIPNADPVSYTILDPFWGLNNSPASSDDFY